MKKKKSILPPAVLEYFKTQGAIGGKRRAKVLTPERRLEISEKANKARKVNRLPLSLISTKP